MIDACRGEWMSLADRLRANAVALQMLHRTGRGIPAKLLPALVADLLRDAAQADALAEAEAFMAAQMPARRAA